MKTIKLSQASRSLAEYASELGDEIVIVTSRARAVAAIVPLRSTDRESLALSSHPEFLDIVQQSRAAARAGRTVSLAAVKQEFIGSKSPRLHPTHGSRSRAPRVPARRRTTGSARRG